MKLKRLSQSIAGITPGSVVIDVQWTFALVTKMMRSKNPRISDAAESIFSALIPHMKKQKAFLPAEVGKLIELLRREHG